MSDRGFVIEVLDYLCAAGRSRRRLLPGIRLNLSKRAPAPISAGRRRGLWFNGSAWHEDEHRTAWDGLQCMSDTRPYGAGKRWPSILWAVVGGTMLLAIAGFVLHASAQTPPASPAPLNGSQWSPIRETMHDLIKSGYALTAVSGVTVNGDVAAKSLLPVARRRSCQMRRSLRHRVGRGDRISVRKARRASPVEVIGMAC
jgi:hypothetical protein